MLAWELQIAYLLLLTGLWIRCSCAGSSVACCSTGWISP